MLRRQFLQTLGAAAGATALGVWGLLPAAAQAHAVQAMEQITGLDRNHDFWKDKLSPAAWDVLFRESTERAWTSPLNDEKRDGTYVCAACYLPLFTSAAKYDSGTGWPSFWEPLADSHIGKKRDFKLILPRTEYHCARCGGHQGHVFNDGPRPTGERWCNNGLALRFVSDDQDLPELRG